MATEKYTVVTTMKNEAPFIVEWVAYHHVLGFNHKIIATNDCEDTTVPLITRLQELGVAKLHKTIVRRGGIQRSALNQATRKHKEALTASWIYICDADEFLNIKIGDGRVEDLLEHVSETTDGISIPWKIFGPSGVQSFSDTPVMQQFLHCETPRFVNQGNYTGKFKKTIYRNFEKYKRPGLHKPVVSEEYKGKTRFEHPGGLRLGELQGMEGSIHAFDFAQVNHYALRSVDSYLVKRARGRANHTKHTLGQSYWNKFNLNAVEDTTIHRHLPEMLEVYESLMSDPQVKSLHDQGVEWHKNKAQEMRQDPKLFDLIKHMEATNVIAK